MKIWVMRNSISCEKVKEDTLWLAVNYGFETTSYSVFMKNEMNFLKIFRNKRVLIVCFWLDSLRISWYLKSNALSSSKSYLETVKLIKKKEKEWFVNNFVSTMFTNSGSRDGIIPLSIIERIWIIYKCGIPYPGIKRDF